MQTRDAGSLPIINPLTVKLCLGILVPVIVAVALILLVIVRSESGNTPHAEGSNKAKAATRVSPEGPAGEVSSRADQPKGKRAVDPRAEKIKVKLAKIPGWGPTILSGFVLDPTVAEVYELSESEFQRLSGAWEKLRNSCSLVDQDKAVVVDIPEAAVHKGISGASSYYGVYVPGSETSWAQLKTDFENELSNIFGKETSGLFLAQIDQALRVMTGQFGRSPRFFRIAVLAPSEPPHYSFEVFGGLSVFGYVDLNQLAWPDGRGDAIISSLRQSKSVGESTEFSTQVPSYLAGIVQLGELLRE